MIKSLYYRLTCHCVTMNPKKESIKSVEHELETLLLIAWMPCLLHHHQHTSRDTPAGKKEEIVRWWDGSINSPRNAIQNITLHMIQIGRTNTRKLWGEGDLYYATAGQKLSFAIKKRKRKQTFVFLFFPSSWPKAYLLISSPGDNGDNENVERTSVYTLCPAINICLGVW